MRKDLNNNSDENSQVSSINDLSIVQTHSSDFNSRNFLLMKKSILSLHCLYSVDNDVFFRFSFK
jgi:hypothetical protein